MNPGRRTPRDPADNVLPAVPLAELTFSPLSGTAGKMPGSTLGFLGRKHGLRY